MDRVGQLDMKSCVYSKEKSLFLVHKRDFLFRKAFLAHATSYRREAPGFL
jgi:hypothetical protein